MCRSTRLLRRCLPHLMLCLLRFLFVRVLSIICFIVRVRLICCYLFLCLYYDP